MFELERINVAKTMCRLYERYLTTASGGNVSFRNSDSYIFITASGVDKSSIDMRDVIVLSPEGKNLTPELNPSMETMMHVNIYKARPDVFAIVHSHPVYASTFAVTGRNINSSISGESRFVLGDVTMIDYFLMGSKKLAFASAESLKNHNAAIMKNHGAITLGKDLFEAFNRMEVLENTAHINFNTMSLGCNCSLLQKDIDEIDNLK